MASTVGDSASYRLGLLGARLTREFGARLAEHGLTHRQLVLLATVDVEPDASQRELADVMGVAPSLVVAAADALVAAGALRRARDTTDRRVQRLELTATGRELLDVAAAVGRELDAELTADLPPIARVGLTHFVAAT